MYDLIVRNGCLVTEDGVVNKDLAVSDGVISLIEDHISADAKEEYDANGLYVLPGGVDVHTHLDMPLNDTLKSADDFVTGSIAAAIGGTTTVVDYAAQQTGGTLSEALAIWKDKAKDSCIDYGLHMSIVSADSGTLDEMEQMVKQGVTSFKVYLVYDMRVSDEELYKILERSASLDTLVTVHCENYGVLKHRCEVLLAHNHTEPKYHPISRPVKCEAEAVNRVLQIAALADAPVYIVHNSCEEGAECIKNAKRQGQVVYGETCPQYLFLDDSKYELPNFEGAKYVMSPPLRKPSDREYLWDAIKNGTISVIATDHCPFWFEEKKLGLHDFTKIPNGGPGIEERIPLMYSEGRKRGLSYTEISKLTATNPAKLFGMYPKKGTIQVGSDADLVIYDPELQVKMSVDMLHENVDYTGYEGIMLTGYPIATFLRGEMLAQDNEYVGPKGIGKYVERSLPMFT